jgi:hypothetical protein
MAGGRYAHILQRLLELFFTVARTSPDCFDPRQQIGFFLRGFLFGVIIPLRFNAQEFLILRDDPKLISLLEFQQI